MISSPSIAIIITILMMIDLLEKASRPLVTSMYDDKIDEIGQAFNYMGEWSAGLDWVTLRQVVRLVTLLVLGVTGIQAWVFLEELANFSWVSLFSLYGVHLAIALTMLSVSPLLSRDSREANLVRKWTHSLNSILFFTYLWQTIIYFAVLRSYLED